MMIEKQMSSFLSFFFKIDFGGARTLSGLMVQGIKNDQAWVQAFQVLFRN